MGIDTPWHPPLRLVDKICGRCVNGGAAHQRYIDRSEDSDGGRADVSIAVKSFVSVGVGNRALRQGTRKGLDKPQGPGAVSPSRC